MSSNGYESGAHDQSTRAALRTSGGNEPEPTIDKAPAMRTKEFRKDYFQDIHRTGTVIPRTPQGHKRQLGELYSSTSPKAEQNNDRDPPVAHANHIT
ncbi:hypothetical protein H9Q73_000415 [Fusarium xylarioides]|nr:hypothetical protein H9Q73_000415 [Fusarium xylarioides]